MAARCSRSWRHDDMTAWIGSRKMESRVAAIGSAGNAAGSSGQKWRPRVAAGSDGGAVWDEAPSWIDFSSCSCFRRQCDKQQRRRGWRRRVGRRLAQSWGRINDPHLNFNLFWFSYSVGLCRRRLEGDLSAPGLEFILNWLMRWSMKWRREWVDRRPSTKRGRSFGRRQRWKWCRQRI